MSTNVFEGWLNVEKCILTIKKDILTNDITLMT